MDGFRPLTGQGGIRYTIRSEARPETCGTEEEITVAIGDHHKRVRAVEFTDALRRKAVDRILLDPAWKGAGLPEKGNRHT